MTPGPQICVVVPAPASAPAAAPSLAGFPIIMAPVTNKAPWPWLVEAHRSGFTHAITMNADDGSAAGTLFEFARLAAVQPDTLLVGRRSLKIAGAPMPFRMLNAVSAFWFRLTTGIRLHDMQCGWRCYPLDTVRGLRVRSRGQAAGVEILIRAAWAGVPLLEVPVATTRIAATNGRSGFRSTGELLRTANMHAKLATAAFCVPRPLLALSARGDLAELPARHRFRTILRHVFSENAETPRHLALAVALGLFCGIAPIWGYQIATTVLLAHKFRLNKAIALTASHISFPLLTPVILAAGLYFGYFLHTGHWLRFTGGDPVRQIPLYLVDWVVGSFALAGLAAVFGGLLAYVLARSFGYAGMKEDS